MTDALDRLTTLRAEVESRRQQMKEAAQEVVKDGTSAIFEEFGDILHSFGWDQYTPYFCDGDPCTFGMHEPWLISKATFDALPDDEYERDDALREMRYEGDYSSAFSEYSEESKVTDRYGGMVDERYVRCKGAVDQVYQVLAVDDLAKDVFGDHVTVTFTAEGVDVDDCDHE